ncbi:MAG: OmpH family outer membrane protein [Bacteroidota bacterium]|jgi:outer membrane protein
MKRFVKICPLVLLLTGAAFAQTNIAHINSEAIMQALPEAIDAQKSLDALVAQWESELQKMQSDWKQRFDDYDKRKLILTDQARAQMERELRDLDREISDFRNNKFGPNGELFQKQNEVMKPIQNKMFKVLEEIAEEDGYDYIFDKSGEILLLYARESKDLTEQVLTRMQVFGK